MDRCQPDYAKQRYDRAGVWPVRVEANDLHEPEGAPEQHQASRAGHSIGHWEGDTLVVDTIGFSPGFLNTPVRNSDKLHVVERFLLDPEKMALTRSYSAEDPVYLKGKYTGSDTIFVADAPYNPANARS